MLRINLDIDKNYISKIIKIKKNSIILELIYKILYNRMSLIMAFCNQLPELFRLAEPEVKREIIQTCVRTLSYNGETLKTELFPIFYKLKYWRNVKNGAQNGVTSEPIHSIISIINNEECQVIFRRIERLKVA
jgi:hypothetical protein